MKYTPKNLLPEELLKLCGFTYEHKGSRGWIRQKVVVPDAPCIVKRATPIKKPEDSSRLHALLEEGGVINLHYDVTVGKAHKSSNNHELVRRMIRRFAHHDHKAFKGLRVVAWEKVEVEDEARLSIVQEDTFSG
jgi:hypothetical protein